MSIHKVNKVESLNTLVDDLILKGKDIDLQGGVIKQNGVPFVGGGGVGMFPGMAAKNAILYDPDATPVTDLVFNNWANVQAYITAGTWTALNPLIVYVAAGVHSIAIVAEPYVSYSGVGHADSTIITGAITSTIGFGDIASIYYSAIRNMRLNNVVGAAIASIYANNCVIGGGTAVANSIISALDCIFVGGDFTACNVLQTANCQLIAGIFPQSGEHNNALVTNGFGYTLNFKGGKFINSMLLGAATFIAGFNAYFYNSTISNTGITFPTLDANETYRFSGCKMANAFVTNDTIFISIGTTLPGVVELYDSPGIEIYNPVVNPADFTGGTTGIIYRKRAQGNLLLHQFQINYDKLPTGLSTLTSNIFASTPYSRIQSARLNWTGWSGGAASALNVSVGVFGSLTNVVNAQDIWTVTGVNDFLFGKNLDNNASAVTLKFDLVGDTFQNIASGILTIEIVEQVGHAP